MAIGAQSGEESKKRKKKKTVEHNDSAVKAKTRKEESGEKLEDMEKSTYSVSTE